MFLLGDNSASEGIRITEKIGEVLSKTMYQGFPDIVVIGNRSRVIEAVNDRGREIFGDVIGRNCYEILRGRDQPCEDCVMMRAETTETERSHDYILTGAQGDSIAIQEMMLWTEPGRWIAMGRMVEERPAFEISFMGLQAALDILADPVALIDTDGAIICCNKSFTQLCSLSPEDVVSARLSSVLSAGLGSDKASQIWEDTKRNGWAGRAKFSLGEEPVRTLSIRTAPLRDMSDDVIGYVCIVGDISDFESSRRELQEEILELERQLEDEMLEMRRRFGQLKILQELGRRMVLCSDEREIAANACSVLVETMSYPTAAIISTSESRGKRMHQLLSGDTKISPGKCGRRINEKPINRALSTRKPTIQKYSEATLSVGLLARSELVIPLVYQDTTFGAIVIADPTEDRFDGEDLSFVETIADLVAISFANCMNTRQLVDREQALDLLDEVTLQAISRMDLTEILSETASRINKILGTQTCLIGMMAADGGVDWIATEGAEEFRDELSGGRYYDVLFSRVVENGSVFFTNDYRPLQSAGFRDGLTVLTNSMLVSPIQLSGDTIGLIALINKLSPSGFTDQDASLVKNFSDHLAVLIHSTETMTSLDYSLRIRNSLLRATFELQVATDMSDIYRRVADMLLEVVPYDSAKFYSIGETGVTAILSLNVGERVDLSSIEDYILDLVINALSERKGCYGTKNSFQSEDGTDQKVSILAIPLNGREDAIGAFVIARSADKGFSDQDLEIATLFANHAAITLENAVLMAREKEMLDESIQRIKQLETILDLTTSVMSVGRDSDAVDKVLRTMISVLGFGRGIVLGITEQDGEWRCLHSSGFSESDADELHKVSLNFKDLMLVLDSAGDWIGERTVTLRFENIKDAARDLYGKILTDLRMDAVSETMFITMEDSREELIGAILLSGTSENLSKRRGMIGLLEIYGNLASIAMNNALLFEREIAARREVETLNDLMTHDINNFIQGVLGYLEMISTDEGVDETHRVYADKAIVQVDNTNRLIENVRKLSRIRSTVIDKPAVFDLKEVVDRAIDFVRTSYPNKSVNFISAIEPGEIHVAGDQMMTELFGNLFSNAVKFTPSSEVSIELVANTQTEPNHDYWRIEIIDQGRGIPDDKKQLVFNRFGEQDESRPYGFGLGLSIVRHLVRKYGGRVWVENRVPENSRKGSRFIVLLPKIELPVPPEPADDTAKKKPREGMKKRVRKVKGRPTKNSSSVRDAEPPRRARNEGVMVSSDEI